MDPTCTDWFESTFFGHRTPVPRAMLLDTDGYDHDLVMRLPVSSTLQSSGGRLADLTQRQSGKSEMMSLQDMVDVVELWVPEADALVTIPDPYQITFEKFIRITDYVGPKEGPYVGLSFSPPVLDNPLPVAPASVWYDLHRIANTIFKKTINQALSQKDVVAYNPAQADEADDLREADDGEFIKSSDPKSIQQVSLGGQNRSNDLFLQEVQILFNYMAQNPDAMAGNMTPGTKGGRETATKASILQNNSTITVEDARGMLYDSAAEVSRRIAWYLHTDPFINVPVIKRSTGGEKQQLTLTPEQRSGNFLDFVFKIKARSMSRLDPQTRTKAILEFSTKVIPSLVVSATAAMSIGVPFNLVKAAVDIGDELGIGEWVAGMFNDPEYQKKIEVMLALGPKNPGKAGGGPNSMAGLMQNGGASQNPVVNTQEQDFNQNAQAGANEGQAGLRGGI
ncbi:MAG: hypothetical protein IMZ53_02880 [Thermoplasmata archaeon]|nr:hypothetical protein [Thermoplasmata archaeon]